MPRGRGKPPMHIPSGTVFAHLTVIREVERSGTNRRFLCRCICGKESIKFLTNLRLGRSLSCGCIGRERGAEARKAIITQRRARAQETDEGRICHTCERWLPWDRFANDPRRARGKASNCLDCARDRTILAAYGLNRSELEWLRECHNDLCALCGEPEKAEGKRRLAIDHDHSCCGAVKACKECIRGLLCASCNRLLGHVEQKPLLRARFDDYLARRPFRSVDVTPR